MIIGGLKGDSTKPYLSFDETNLQRKIQEFFFHFVLLEAYYQKSLSVKICFDFSEGKVFLVVILIR